MGCQLHRGKKESADAPNQVKKEKLSQRPSVMLLEASTIRLLNETNELLPGRYDVKIPAHVDQMEGRELERIADQLQLPRM